MPEYRFWEWSSPEEKRKKDAENFLANAQQARQQADHAELQQHVGNILENFQNDVSQRMQSWMPQAQAAPQPDPVAQAIEVARATSPPAEPAAPQPSIIDQAIDAGRGFVAKAADSASTAGRNLAGNADNALTGASAALKSSPIAGVIDTALEMTGVNDAQKTMQRQREITDEAVKQGFDMGPQDPRFARANPDLATEYGDLDQQKAMGAMGQGDIKIAGALFGAAKQPLLTAAEKITAASYGHATPGVDLSLKGLKYQLFDNLAPVQEVMNSLQNTLGRKLTDAEDAYQILRLGRASAETGDSWFRNHVESTLGSLDQISGSVTQGRKDLNNYLRAQDAIDKAASNPTRNFGGMRLPEAQQTLADMQTRLGPQNYAALEQGANQFYNLGNDLLDRKVKAGLVSPTLATQLKAQYPHYMPIQVIDWLDDNMASTATRVGRAGGAANDIKALTEFGTDRAAEEPIQAFYRAAQRTAMLTAKNEGALALVEAAKTAPIIQGLIRPADNVAAKFMGHPTGAASSFARTPGEQVLQLRQNGETMKFFVDKSLQPLVEYGVTTGAGAWQPIIDKLAGAANLVRKGAIAYNPTWGVGQFGMDSLSFLIKEGGLLGDPAKNLGYLGQGLKGAVRGDALYKAAREAGALPGAAEHATGRAGSYDKIVQGMTGRDITSPTEFMKWAKDTLLGGLQGFNETLDAAPRLAEFAKQRDMGATAAKAALAARDVTLDPSRGGQLVRTINTVVPFFNVAFQGAAYMPRMLANPETRNKAIAGITSSVMMPTMALEYENQQDPRYADVPDFDKDRGLIIMNPYARGKIDPTTGQEKPSYFLIRTGPFTPFVILSRALYNQATGNEPHLAKTAVGLTKNLSPLDAASPLEAALSGGDVGQAVGNASMAMLPAGARQVVETVANRDTFRNRDIVPQSLQHLPAEQQYTSETSETAKFLSQKISDASGGRFAFAPASVDHLLRAWGGASEAIVGLSDAAGGAANAQIKNATGLDAGFGTAGDSARMQKLRRDIAQTGITDEKRADLQNEIDRELDIKADRDSSLRNVPIIGGLASKYYREAGGQTLDDRTKAVDAALIEKKRDQGATGKELARQGKSFSDVTGDIRGVKLTRAQQADYRENALAYRTRLVDDLMKSDIYKSSDDVSRKRLIDDVMERGAGWASQEVLPGRSETGREFVTSEVGADIENAAPRYIKSLTDAAELDKLRATQRFRNVDAKDYAQVSADVAKMQQYQQVLGKYEARMVLTNEIGAERMAKAMNANENPRWQSTLADFRRTHPDYELFVGSQPRTMTQHGLAPAAVARLAGLGR